MARHALQVELYGLSQGQRDQGATIVNQALDSEQAEDVMARMVEANKTTRNGTCLFVEADFSSDLSGQRIFNAARNWANGRSEDAVTGFHSYVRVRTVDPNDGSVTQRLASSPGWVEQITTEA